mmetsp:Transcript_14606/g.47769  ORF Transcript_14606/g.47769 Transcript_14606/m.47769 type:complete len:133 (-) Transcript_14606:186-584(-)
MRGKDVRDTGRNGRVRAPRDAKISQDPPTSEAVVFCFSTRHCITCENMTSLVLDFGEPHTYVSPEHEADPSEFCLVHRRRKETLLDVCCAFQRPFDHVLLLLDALSETVNQIRAPIENLWHSLFAPPDIENF